MSVLESKSTEATAETKLESVARATGFDNYGHLIECFEYLGARIDGYGKLDHLSLKSLHILLAHHAPAQLESQFASVRDRFFDRPNGETVSFALKPELAGGEAVQLHPLRFLAGHCISHDRWTEFTVALSWLDSWSSKSFQGKGLVSRLDIVRYGKYADPTLLATVQKVIDSAKSTKASKLLKAGRDIDAALRDRNIGPHSFGFFLNRAGLSRQKMETYLALAPGHAFSFEFDKVLCQFENEYWETLKKNGVKAAFDLWGESGFFKKYDLEKTKELLAALHRSLPDFGGELDQEFKSLAPGDDVGFEMFLAKVARSHRALIELPISQARKLKVEAEQLRIQALRDFYASEEAIRFDGRYVIEDKNPTQDI